MRRHLRNLTLAVALFFVLLGTASAYTIDGSIVNDWLVNMPTSAVSDYFDNNLPSGGNDIDVVTDDEAHAGISGQTYLNPGYTAGGNIYDIEALYFDNDATYGYIALVTGQSPTHTWGLGDIGIDITDTGANLYDGDTLAAMPTTPYELAIDFGSSGASLKSVVDWYNVYYDLTPAPNHSASNPWAVRTDSGVDKVVDYAWQSYDNQIWVYEFRFLLADVGLSGSTEEAAIKLHWTMQCGNDYVNLNADVNPVPEPATMLLLGFGLVALAGFGRRQFIS